MSNNVHLLKRLPDDASSQPIPPKHLSVSQTAADTSLRQARIAARHDVGYTLDGIDARARRAYSCLVEPQAGDLVLLSVTPNAAPYILAVLERPDAQTATLSLPGDNRIDLQPGQMQLKSDALSLQGARSLDVGAPSLQVTAHSAQVTAKHWGAWFDTFNACGLTIEYTAKTLSARLGRLFTRSVEAFRTVDGLDETRAGRTRTVVKEHYQLRAGHITEKAEGFVRIDGQKIDLG